MADVEMPITDCVVVGDDHTHAKELLLAGVALARVIDLCRGRLSEKELHAIAREVVIQNSSPNPELGVAVLQRSRSSADDHNFMDKFMESLRSEAPEEFIDPLMSTLMKDPVVISSGYVLDRATIVDGDGNLKIQRCPFTREPLKHDVYPIVFHRDKLQEFKKGRLNSLVTTAKALLGHGLEKISEFSRLIQIAETFLDDLGDEVYIHESRELAELRLAAANIPGNSTSPHELANIFIRIHRTVQSHEVVTFQEKVSVFLESATQALREDRLQDASAWCDACTCLQKACGISLHSARIVLQVAKRRGEDLKIPRQLVYREIKHDPDAVNAFLAEECIGLEDFQDLEPFRLFRRRVNDVSMHDNWIVAVKSEPLETTVTKVEVAARQFGDQGWGNQKANLSLALYDAHGAEVARTNLFGTYRTPDCSYGQSPSRTLCEEAVVVEALPGFVYSLEYTVGGGGGHKTNVNDWSCKIFPTLSDTNFVSCRMRDPEGDEGNYIGPGDANGQAHGKGELVYDDGEIFIGQFSQGSMIDGVVYHINGRSRCTMLAGSWTDDIDHSIVDRFPFAKPNIQDDNIDNGSDHGSGMYDDDYDDVSSDMSGGFD